MSLTREQAEAAFSPCSVAVVAGAGTGKTFMLTQRYLHHLASGLTPLEIVAVTFTERAAAELRSRVRQAVQGSTPDAEALAELEAAQISTLHALAARICRDHPDEAEVPADFGVLDDLDKPVWLGEQFAEALHALELGTLNNVPYSRLRALLWRLVQEPSISEAAFEQSPKGWPDLLQRIQAQAARALRESPDFQAAVHTLKRTQGAEGDKIEGARHQALSGLAALDAGAWREALEHFGAINLQGGSKKNWPPGDLDAVKAALKTLREGVKDAAVLALELGPADQRLAELLPALSGAFRAVLAGLQVAKREARVLDFADLELHALRALGHAHVRAHYAARWQAFLIDEFQDTSPIQAALLARLTEQATVTLVGDEKQAIYSFRGADAAVFEKVRGELSAGGGKFAALSESFRTHAPLVEAVNTVFESVMGRTYEGLRAARLESPGEGPFVSLRAVAAERGVRKLSRRVQEARALGETMKAFVATGMPVQDGAGTRPLTWGDIAILTRTWSPLDTFSEVFSALGIPAVHTGGGNLLETREAKDGLALVRVLADPHDDLALAALLRSPFFSLDDPTLTRFAQGLEVGGAWWDGLNGSDGALERARTTLSALVGLRHHATPTRLVQQADYLTGYSAVLANLPGAERRLADWRGFLDLVRRLEGSLADVFVVARRLRRLLQVEADLPRPTLEAGDAVSLMTIHKSKGLEWPLVVVADLDYAPRARSTDVLIDRHLGVAFEVEDPLGQQLEPALFTLLKAQVKAAEAEEVKRVLYVALTRARDRLILSATQAKGGGLDVLAPGLEALGLGCEALPFDPELSLYPPLPEPAAVGVLEGDALWSRTPEALGPYRRYLEPKGAGQVKGLPSLEAWDEVLVWVGDLDDAYVPHLEALRDTGIAAPHPDTVGRELTRSGGVTLHVAVCVWMCEGFDLALVDSAVPDEVFDQRLLRLEPESSPLKTVSLIQNALRGKPCVS